MNEDPATRPIPLPRSQKHLADGREAEGQKDNGRGAGRETERLDEQGRNGRHGYGST